MRKDYFFVALLFIFLIILVTFPLVFGLNQYIPGFFSTDESFSPLWECWRLDFSFKHHLPLMSTNLVAFPFGLDLYNSGYISYLWFWINFLLGISVSPPAAYNIQVLVNLFLSGIFSYLLVYYVTGSRLSALFSAIIFVFCPFQSVRRWQHLGLTFNQWIPLVIFLAIRLRDNNCRKNRLFLLLGLLLLFSFDWSIILMTMTALFFLLIYVVLYQWRKKFFAGRNALKQDFAYIKRVFFISLIAFLILLPQFFTAIKGRLLLSKTAPASAFNIYRRPLEDLFSQSAKPLSYFLPATVHPILGRFTESFIGTPLYGMSLTEHTLYLGWIPLILAFLAFRRWRREKSGDFYIGFFIFLAIAAWLFSQPPWWQFGHFKLYMPSFFMYKILPVFRAYCRFGIVVMLAVAVLAGFGIKFILEKFKTRASRIAITALFSALVLFEFWNWPPYKVIDVSKAPEVYYWLKEQPGDFVIAEYPLDADSPNELYKLYQTKHEKRLINGTIPGTAANQSSKALKKLSSKETVIGLDKIGVRYILVHHDGYLETELLEDRKELENIPQNRALVLIKSFPAQNCPRSDIICIQTSGQIDVYAIEKRYLPILYIYGPIWIF
ncbi:MAG: hypothetical protein PHN59_01445 [Candidatus Omnitrophica bacterium]|nr:hypothetical protein [Candidatus Omnitrophota bacterium]